MAFLLYGAGINHPAPVNTLFDRSTVNEAVKTTAKRAIDAKEHRRDVSEDKESEDMRKLYEHVSQIKEKVPALTADQIMQSPVITIDPDTTIKEALALFRDRGFRHIPVMSANNKLIGMVSDRDIYRSISGLDEEKTQQPTVAQDAVNKIMQQQVLTASEDTDIRMIARLFVDQNVGAMPIMTDNKLVGIITRTDVLASLVRHYVLELWA